ncbi:hypothetical protein [Streptomyces albus]|uniref:hypothetical protein n=1 Tax=Streptomyces albus TaxID=1888 RepID=UPI0034031232
MSIQRITTCHSLGELWASFYANLLLRCEHTPGRPGARAGDMTIEAIPTWYGNTTFRSRLEADWAATLDTLDIAWQYEPETITLPSGTRYIPDFWLPDIGVWLEVKGTGVPRIEKAIELGEARACRCDGACTCDWPGGELVVIGHPAEPYNAWADPDNDGLPHEAIRVRRRRHSGHINWSAAHGRTPWLTRCGHCRRGVWSTTAWCRACKRRLTGNLHQPADPTLQFVASENLPRPDQHPTNDYEEAA